MVPDLDLRLVRYFTVVAEHLNFARAAEELRVAQPSLSRQIQRLEAALGVRLLERTTQGSRLTAAGAAFLPEAQRLLHDAGQAVRTARAATTTITIGYAEDLLVTPAVRDLRHRFPGARVRTRHLGAQDTGALADRRVDALVTRTPLPAGDLDVTVLHDEPLVLVVPATHRLAGKESVGAADVAAEPLAGCVGMGADWIGFWRLEPRAGGAPAPLGPGTADSYDDKLEAIADGTAVAVLPAGDRRFTLRPGLVTVPITGAGPCQVVVATRAGETDPLVAEFVRSAARLLTGDAPAA
ncbi:DNA-binding transcriptional LysR family regulator [Catenuloplanes nepalensis]|uniref:DNA-binding transcriptional LysR family regulator n=1 Tax=Catenuloplanes nepalensis TaxID=587533 RepID=A0ABT9MSG7_9ACTN|nr:LysR family transcriptional regulator [Catenuloplanes nepalensis]MDP9794382.1 DNA-binding transcriptional LysR family regulator [Catenuloplanes nepalensis]